VLASKFYSAPEVASMARDFSSAGLSKSEVALMAFAEKVSSRAHEITETDIDELRSHGFTDPEIFDIAATAAARCFFSKLLDALGVEPDSVYRELDPDLQSTLTVGRPIEE
jgi:alkylhydroperoxidase family enzyme